MDKIKDYILTIQNAMPLNQLEILKEVCDADVLGGEQGRLGLNDDYDPNMRKTKVTYMYNAGEHCTSMTMAYWTNYLIKLFCHYRNVYCKTFDFGNDLRLQEIQLLTYQKGDFYKKHIDSFRSVPRHLSFIFLVNDDYEGGDLVFELKNEEVKIPIEQNKLIIWPSNFMYPHKVLPITKGIKYSVVSWAL